MPLDVFGCLTNDFISSAPQASDLFLSTTPQYFTGAEKCLGTARREYIWGCIYLPTSIFPCGDLVSCRGCQPPPPPPEGKIRGDVCVTKPREVSNERYYPSWGFSTRRSISLPLEQTDRLSSPGWMAKINLLTSPSPNTRFGWKSVRNIVSPLSLVQCRPAVMVINHPLQHPDPADLLTDSLFTPLLLFFPLISLLCLFSSIFFGHTKTVLCGLNIWVSR